MMMIKVGRILVGCCMVWILLFLLTGPTGNGKLFFSSFIQDKAGVPVVGIVVPIFLAGIIACFLTLPTNSQQKVNGHDNNNNNNTATASATRAVHNELFQLMSSLQSRNTFCDKVVLVPLRILQQILIFISPNKGGDIDFNNTGFWLLFVPLVWYSILSSWRKCSDVVFLTDEFYKNIANCFGIASIIGFGVLLVPVARHSIIINCMGWNPASSIQLHTWIGRFIILGISVHGITHALRWIIGQQNSLLLIVLPPPTQCWKYIIGSIIILKKEYNEQQLPIDDVNIDDDDDDDNQELDEKICLLLFQNWTGIIGFTLLGLIGVTSFIRRRYYRLFYTVHVIAGPTVFVIAVLHWNRSTIYIAASALYYTACSFPVFTERYYYYNKQQQQQRRTNCCTGTSVNITGFEIINNNNNDTTTATRPVTCITFEASQNAMTQFQPGQYIMLRVPSISNIAHPFTVNAVVEHNNKTNNYDEDGIECTNHLRILCRSTGPFTKALSKAVARVVNNEDINLTTTTTNAVPPTMYIEGFYGSCQRIEQVYQHDIVVFAAAGIGITPYLSLLHSIQNEHFLNTRTESHSFENRRIHLHWVCRERHLIDYIKKEYFIPLLDKQQYYMQQCELEKCINYQSTSLSFHIVIHYTGTEPQHQHQQQPIEDDNTCSADVEASCLEQKGSAIEAPCFEEQGSKIDQPTGPKDEFDTFNVDQVPFNPSMYSMASKQSYSSNLPSAVSFAMIYGVGFPIVWYLYIQADRSINNVLPRLYSPIFVLFYGLLVSLIINSFTWTCYNGGWNSKTARYTLAEVEARHERVSCESTSTTSSSYNSVELSEIGLQGGNVHSNQLDVRAELVSLDSFNCTDDNVSNMEERLGRPSMHQFVNILDTGSSPGLFACGPVEFLQDIRTTVLHRCLARCRQCVRRERKKRRSSRTNTTTLTTQSSTIAFYEESFEL